ncbi:LITAF-like zinc ribbon domain-containing protein [Blakeslea trispora]|nr:LITAF-like zinc ribbon domain-containing protein [Blakeslea trispora]
MIFNFVILSLFFLSFSFSCNNQSMPQPYINPHLELPPTSPPQHDATLYPQVPQNQYSYPTTMPQPYTAQIPIAPPPYTAPVRPIFYGAMPSPHITATPEIQPITTLKTTSALVQCPHCNQCVYTLLDYDSGACTGLSVAGLFMAGLHAGGCLLPLLFPWTKDVVHRCPACKQKIATWTRLGRDTEVHPY